MAFHNLSFAKDDDAIDVQVYSISDLSEFSLYANRLRYRIMLLYVDLVIPRESENIKAFKFASIFSVLVKMVAIITERSDLDKMQIDDLKKKTNTALDDMTKYADVARHMDSSFYNLEAGALKSFRVVLNEIALLSSKENLVKEQIPGRLLKQNQASRKGDVGQKRKTRNRGQG